MVSAGYTMIGSLHTLAKTVFIGVRQWALPCVTFLNILFFYLDEVFSPRPNFKLEDIQVFTHKLRFFVTS